MFLENIEDTRAGARWPSLASLDTEGCWLTLLRFSNWSKQCAFPHFPDKGLKSQITIYQCIQFKFNSDDSDTVIGELVLQSDRADCYDTRVGCSRIGLFCGLGSTF